MAHSIRVRYKNTKPSHAFMSDNWVKGILVFNHSGTILCHRIGYGEKRRKNAVGIWHITYK